MGQSSWKMRGGGGKKNKELNIVGWLKVWALGWKEHVRSRHSETHTKRGRAVNYTREQHNDKQRKKSVQVRLRHPTPERKGPRKVEEREGSGWGGEEYRVWVGVKGKNPCSCRKKGKRKRERVWGVDKSGLGSRRKFQ